MNRNIFLVFIGFFLLWNSLAAQYESNIEIVWDIELSDVFIAGSNTTIEINAHFDGDYRELKDKYANVLINGQSYPLSWEGLKGTAEYPISSNDDHISVEIGNEVFEKTIKPIPLWLSIIPPLVAIFLALVFREVITALFIGILSGAMIVGYYSEGVIGLFTGFLHVVDKYLLNALDDWSHLAVIVFSMTIGAVVSIISKNGGMRGIVNRLEPFAHNPKSGQFVIWFMGILIFFDDYANTLVVGNTMRPVADRLRI